MQEIFYITILSLSSIAVLLILDKLMGYRQMSEMSMFDYITSITIGSIAAEMATNLEDFTRPLAAMIIYGLVTALFSILCSKSIVFRRLLNGKPLVLYDKGILYEKNLNTAKIDVSEFLVQCRVNGYFELSDIQTAVLESNGKISFLPKADKRPLQPCDLKLSPDQDYLVANIIIDGSILEKNLQHTGKDTVWLRKQANLHGISDISQVLLATCDMQDKIHFYLKTGEKMTIDILE